MPRLYYIIALILLTTVKLEAATLSFSPQRLVLDGRTNNASLTLTNTGSEISTFRISLSDVIYNDDGSVTHVDTPPENFPSARKYIRISPKQVNLRPGESQTVRALLRLPKAFTDGEYRIHAILKELPPPLPLDVTNKNRPSPVMFSQAVAIPIIVRRGQGKAVAEIANAHRTPKGLSLTIARSGNKSLYTDIEIYTGSVSQNNQVSILKGFAVPVPNKHRTINLALKKNSQKPYIVLIKDHDSGEILTQRNIP
jgi:P pilus assembly chaperone PapD